MHLLSRNRPHSNSVCPCSRRANSVLRSPIKGAQAAKLHHELRGAVAQPDVTLGLVSASRGIGAYVPSWGHAPTVMCVWWAGVPTSLRTASQHRTHLDLHTTSVHQHLLTTLENNFNFNWTAVLVFFFACFLELVGLLLYLCGLPYRRVWPHGSSLV